MNKHSACRRSVFFTNDTCTKASQQKIRLVKTPDLGVFLSQAYQHGQKALRFGATEICPMTTEDDWRIGKLKDPFGHIWEIGYTL